MDGGSVAALYGVGGTNTLDYSNWSGDVLFNPSWMWHSVRNESPTIGLRYGLYHPKTMVSESYTLFLVRVLAARNPSVLRGLYYSLVRSNVPQEGNEILIGKISRG